MKTFIFSSSRFFIQTVAFSVLFLLNAVQFPLMAAPGDLLATYTEDVGGDDTFNSAVVKNGKVIAGGTTDVNGSLDFLLVKYDLTPTGPVLDTTFNSGAPIIYDFLGTAQDSWGEWVGVDDVDTDLDGVDDDYEIYIGGTAETALALGAALRFSSDGVLDLGYGNQGEAFLCDDAYGFDGFVNEDGEVFMTGTKIEVFGFETAFWTGKLLSSGAGDSSFGSVNGAQVEWGIPGLESGFSTVDYDGMILSVGNTSVTGTDVHLIRYLNTGALDVGFGGGTGKVTTTSIAIGGINYIPSVVDTALKQRNNQSRIIVAGRGILPGGTGHELFLIQYHEDGLIDTNFGSAGTGIVRDTLGLADPVPVAVAIDGNLRTVVVGTIPTGMWIARYDRFGVLDASFGVGGLVTTNGNEQVKDVVIMPNGRKIMCVGNVGQDGFLYLFDG